MGYSKRQLVTQALEEIGIASYTFDIEPEQLQSALYKLDAMMATWNARGIRLGYPIPSSPEDSSLDDDSNIPDAANESVFLNLAIRLAPSYGKIVLQETKKSAFSSYRNLLARAVKPSEMQLQSIPSGAGNKTWRYGHGEFFGGPTETLDAGDDSELIFE